MLITKSQFESLKSLTKEFKNQNLSIYLEGERNKRTKWTEEIVNTDNKELFLLDYFRPRLEISKIKITFNIRYRNTIRLLRIDLSGIHTNPEELGGETFEGPHIHIYDERFHDRIAYPLSKIGIDVQEIKTIDIYTILKKLLDYFNTKHPTFRPQLEF